MTSGKPANDAKEERISRWILPSKSRSIRSLELDRDATLGYPGENEVRVKLCAAGLNYRDLMIAKVSISIMSGNELELWKTWR